MSAAVSLDPFAGVCKAMVRPAAPGLLEASRRAKGRPEAAAGHRRSAERFNVAATVVARPVDADGCPAGEPFEGVVADVSAGGLRLLHSRFLPTSHLAVKLPADRAGGVATLVMLVARVAAVGRYYEYAGPFVARYEVSRRETR